MCGLCSLCCCVFFFKQKTAYEMRISDWSSDVCSSDLRKGLLPMRNWIKALAVTSAIATGLVAAPALYAVESEGAEGQMMGTSMMGEGGMMGMMQQMSKMMEGCGKMMQSAAPGGAERPNEQWRQNAPREGKAAAPNRRGKP